MDQPVEDKLREELLYETDKTTESTEPVSNYEYFTYGLPISILVKQIPRRSSQLCLVNKGWECGILYW